MLSGEKGIYTACVAFQQWWKLRHERFGCRKNVLLKRSVVFTDMRKIFTHPRAKNTLGHVGKGGRPGEHHQNLWNFVLLWFIYFWRPCQKHESFKQISYIPTCWKSTSKICKLKHPLQLQYSIHHYPPEAKHPPIIRVFFSMMSKALHEKTGRQREHTLGKPGEPSVDNPSWVG